MFFFLTLYMQTVLHCRRSKLAPPTYRSPPASSSPAAISPKLFARFGTRPVIISGSLISAAAIFYLSRIPVNGTFLTDFLPGLSSCRSGSARSSSAPPSPQTPASPKPSRLAAGLFNTSLQLGVALGLAIFSALATARTNDRLAAHASRPEALVAGYSTALLTSSIFLAAAALIALRTVNSRGDATATDHPDANPALEVA